MSGHKRLLGALTLSLAAVALATGLWSGSASASGPQVAGPAPPALARSTLPGSASRRVVAPLVASSVAASAAPVMAASRPVRIDLYAPGVFVSQTNLVQCVGASMQMMLNIIGPTHDATAATQHRLFELAVALGDPRSPYAGGAHGASAQGWAAGLTAAGGGFYAVRSAPTLEAALALAAVAITQTGRPVGLLMWQGAHAWVMSGFEAAADSLTDPATRVTAVRVLDPLYPRPIDAPWGPGPAPDARLSVAQLGRVFVPYRPHGRQVALRNQYVLVLPLQPTLLATLRFLPV